jgi:hypothetical protein
MDGAAPKKNFMLIASGAVLGLLYGASIRFGSRMFPNSSVFVVVSLGFVVFLPLAMGFVSVFIVERRRPQPLWIWFLLPWIPLLAGEAAAMIVAWEGLICIVMFTPIGMVASSLGGVAAGLIARYAMSQRVKNASAVCVLFLPLLVSPLEQRFHAQGEFRRIETVIDIQASPDVVWRNIERVRRINPAELRPSWSRRIGFPNPVEATLSYEGVGGVRHASFDGGVLFIETIDLWQPQRRLAFSIKAQTAQIPPTTLDEHVTVGGAFFDVLRGEYTLELLANGTTRLHLESQHRVSTDFNWYAHLWTDAIMADLQNTILLVVKNRCESGADPASLGVSSVTTEP